MLRRFLRKAGVAERYDIDPRSVDRWAASGKIPPPFYHKGSRIPLWDVAELDENDKAAAALGRAAEEVA
jgi:hypothetical protein